jgi:hypothetical protein
MQLRPQLTIWNHPRGKISQIKAAIIYELMHLSRNISKNRRKLKKDNSFEAEFAVNTSIFLDRIFAYI